jgi:hypothetical protein
MSLKRRLLSVLLAVCLAASLLILPAAAAGNIHDMNGTANIGGSFNTTDGGTASATASGRPKLLLFCQSGCMNCQQVSQALDADNISNSADVIVAFINEDNDSTTAVDAYISNYGISGAKYSYYSYSNSNLCFKYARMIGATNSITTPLTVLIDSNDKILMISTEEDGVVSEICSRLGITDSSSGGATGARAVSRDTSYDSDEWGVLALTNKERAANGVQPQTMIPAMQRAANTRAIEVSEYFSHTRPDGSDCFTVYGDVGLSYNSVAENIAAGQDSPADVVSSWIHSSGHHANMIDPDTVHTGVGFEPAGDYGTSWVQIFLSDYCSISDIWVETPSGGITVPAGTSTDDMGAVLHATCTVHGDSYCPLISELCSGYDSSKVGTQTVSVSAYGKTAAFDVTVTPAKVTLKSISVYSLPDKTAYSVGDTLNTAGLALKAVMSDGSTKTVSDGFTCSPTALSTAGTQKITVTYGGQTASFNVTVSEKAVKSISIYSLPDKTAYSVGDTLNTAGLALKAVMSDGSTKTVSDGFTCSPTKLSTAGTQKITVTYGGQTASFNVTVNAAASAVHFTDVSSGDWYYSYVTDLAGKGILNGSTNPDGSSSFRPNGSVTRSEFAAILARASGESVYDYSGTSSFYDVASDNWASPYIEWANANGIASGSGGAFRPQAKITRQEMAAMIFRFSSHIGKALPPVNAPASFTDAASIASWAVQPVRDLQIAGIIGGIANADGTYLFNPLGSATRAEAAKMISVLLSK